MKTLFQINVCVNQKSTGRIVEQLGALALKRGWNSYAAGVDVSLPSRSETVVIPDGPERYLHRAMARFLDGQGLGSRYSTRRLIDRIQSVRPDVIHLHNLHCAYLNYPLLFRFLKAYNRPVVWTLHDCWAMTGHCTHFDSIGCEKWKSECADCPQIPFISLDASRENFRRKKEMFTSLEHLTLVPVSHWLASVAKESFLSDIPLRVIKNGIDLQVFTPGDKQEARQKLGWDPDAFIVFGASTAWSDSKGIREMVYLSEKLNATVALAGVSGAMRSRLPQRMITLPLLREPSRLADCYRAADVFVNPTYNDSFPTVNIEALACGTPVVTYRTGGAAEIIDGRTGMAIDRGDREALLRAVCRMSEGEAVRLAPFCRERAEREFEMHRNFSQYFDLYEQLC